MRDVQREFANVAGVRAASYSHLGIFSGGTSSMSISIDGFAPQEDDDRGSAVDAAGPGYFATLGIPVLQGREFVDSDTADSPRVCVINEAFAKRFFAGRNPVGLQLNIVADDESKTPYQIVGVVGNSRTEDLRGEIGHRFYLPTGQRGAQSSPFFLIRTTGATAPAISDLRAVVQRVDANLSVRSAVTMHEQMAPLVAQDRTTAQLVLTFGGVALVLAAIGLYGVLSYGISRRAGEIAVRMALGAQRGRVIAMILRETAGLVCGGLIVGLAIAFAGSELIASRLYGVAPEDPLTLAVAVGLLLAVAFVATYLPARRASRLEPIAALQQR
jgi:predicted permease